MNKYINTEKLIAELGGYENTAIEAYNPLGEDADFWHGKVVACEDLKTLIASLQQDKETLELCAQIWWEEQGWIMIPPDVTVEGIESLLKQVRKILQQEQPGVDLEKEAVSFCFDNGINLSPRQAKNIARHFYELGLNTRKEENK